MKHHKIIIIVFFITLVSSAQTGGKSVYSFLNYSTSARQTALGGSVLTLVDDINQPLWNPATINEELDAKSSFNYVNFLKDFNYVSTSYAYNVDRHVGTFHTGLTYLNYGTFIGANENGDETGVFKAYDLALSVGYAYNIPKSNFFVGSNLKVINSVIEQYTSFGIATDIGVLYYHTDKPYRFAAVVRNLGIQLTHYTDTREPLPLQISAGGSYQLEHVPIRFYGTLDNLQKWKLAYENSADTTTDFDGNIINNKPSFFNNSMRHLSAGVELFPDHGFTLRGGINFQRLNELALKNKRTFAGINLGFGIKLKRFKLNYAFPKFHPVADTHSFSLEVNLH